tara:strand:- start:2 stop:490 length:489 start_codon:yes stop_codon:yes gene_type:complete
MDQKNNGRVNLNVPNIQDKFNMFDKIPVDSRSYHDALTGNSYNTQLSDLYFSKENVQIIQNAIRAGVYKRSNGEHIISNQNLDTIHIIMRSIFLQNSKNLPNNITEQIKELNGLVIEEIVPKLLGEIEGYLVYRKDISEIPEPLQKPKSDNIAKHLEFKKFF